MYMEQDYTGALEGEVEADSAYGRLWPELHDEGVV
jgi:hypothetical protein